MFSVSNACILCSSRTFWGIQNAFIRYGTYIKNTEYILLKLTWRTQQNTFCVLHLWEHRICASNECGWGTWKVYIYKYKTNCMRLNVNLVSYNLSYIYIYIHSIFLRLNVHLVSYNLSYIDTWYKLYETKCTFRLRNMECIYIYKWGIWNVLFCI